MATSPRKTRKNSTTSLAITWDDTGLRKIFDELNPEQQAKANRDALRIAGSTLRKMVVADARAMGLGRTSRRRDEGWEWQTYGRIARSITTGKAWWRGRIAGIRVYAQASRSKPFLSRAYHANPVIVGYKQKIPSGAGQPAIFSGERKAGKPIFANARRRAPSVFKKAVESNLQRLIKRLNKKYGGTT